MSNCVHIYQLVGLAICPHCGKDTHEIDWVKALEYRRAYAEKVGLDYKNVGWTSI